MYELHVATLCCGLSIKRYSLKYQLAAIIACMLVCHLTFYLLEVSYIVYAFLLRSILLLLCLIGSMLTLRFNLFSLYFISQEKLFKEDGFNFPGAFTLFQCFAFSLYALAEQVLIYRQPRKYVSSLLLPHPSLLASIYSNYYQPQRRPSIPHRRWFLHNRWLLMWPQRTYVLELSHMGECSCARCQLFTYTLAIINSVSLQVFENGRRDGR